MPEIEELHQHRVALGRLLTLADYHNAMGHADLAETYVVGAFAVGDRITSGIGPAVESDDFHTVYPQVA